MNKKYFWSAFILGFLLALYISYSTVKSFFEPEVDIFKIQYVSVGKMSYTLEKNYSKVRLISFWATWCMPCVKEFSAFQKMKEKYPEALEIIAVSDENPNKIIEFVAKNKYDFNFLISSKDFDSIGISARPVNVIIDRRGNTLLFKVGMLTDNEIETALKLEK